MSGFLVCLSLILGLTGIVGSFVSALPGPPLAFVGLLLLMFVPQAQINVWFVVIMGVIALIITVADFLIPIYGTKKTGGSKYGMRGSTIGLLVGMFLLPLLGISIGPFGILGIILCPFLGAYLGEVYKGNKDNALKSAFGSLIGLLVGILLKALYSIVAFIFIIKESIAILF